MKKFKMLTAVAVLAVSTLATSSANAQWGGQQGQQAGFNFNQGSNWGQQNRMDWNVQQGTTFQNQRAAAIGGILSGIGAGLGNNPKNGQASAILNGIGGGMMQAAGRHDFSQGSVIQSQQGYQNNWGRVNAYRQPYNSWNNGQNQGFGGQMNQGMNHGFGGQMNQGTNQGFGGQTNQGFGGRRMGRGW